MPTDYRGPWLLVRGRRAGSPILLKLHGGPGQAEMATVGLNGLLENDFIDVAQGRAGGRLPIPRCSAGFLGCPAVRDGRALPAVTALLSGDGRKVMLPG